MTPIQPYELVKFIHSSIYRTLAIVALVFTEIGSRIIESIVRDSEACTFLVFTRWDTHWKRRHFQSPRRRWLRCRLWLRRRWGKGIRALLCKVFCKILLKSNLLSCKFGIITHYADLMLQRIAHFAPFISEEYGHESFSLLTWRASSLRII